MSHTHKQPSSYKTGITLAFWLNLLFSIVELVGGIFTNSTAIIADAFHDLMDAIAIGIAVLLEKISGKKRTEKFTYGYKRFSLLSALGMSVFLIVGAIWMINSAIHSFLEPREVNSMGMLWLAVLGIAVNGFAFLSVKKGNGNDLHHGHSHGTAHSHSNKAIMLHLLEDVLSWVAVLVGAVVIYFTGWNWVDGALTLLIAFYVSYNALINLIETMKVLLQTVPESIDIAALTKDLGQLTGVHDVHDVHIWSLDGNYNIGSLHVVVKDKSKENNIRALILQLMEKHRIQHPTVQIEWGRCTCALGDC